MCQKSYFQLPHCQIEKFKAYTASQYGVPNGFVWDNVTEMATDTTSLKKGPEKLCQ